MTTDREGPGAMLTIGATASLMQAGMHEIQALLFHRKKRREKQRT